MLEDVSFGRVLGICAFRPSYGGRGILGVVGREIAHYVAYTQGGDIYLRMVKYGPRESLST